MVDLEQDTGLELLEDKLQKRDYLHCIELGNKLLDDARSQSVERTDAAKTKIACYIAIGDANFGLKLFQEALIQYEKARKLAEGKYGALSVESMPTLFRLERALRALAALEGGGETKNVLTSALLLGSQSSQDAAPRRASGRHSRTLQGLWAVALDKQKFHAANPIVSFIEAVFQKLENAGVEEFLARLSILVSLIGLVGMLIYAWFWWQSHPYQTVVPHWLRWNGFALQDPSGTTYYHTSEPEYIVVGKMYALGNWAQEYFKKHGRYPSAGDHDRHDELNYGNPLTRRREKALLINGHEDTRALPAVCAAGGLVAHPGMIVCIAGGPRRFVIGAFDRNRNAIQTANAPNGLLSLNPNQKLAAPATLNDLLAKSQGIILVEKPIDQLSDFLGAHSAFAALTLVLASGVVGPAIFLLTRNWTTALRSKKKPNTKPEAAGSQDNTKVPPE